MTTRRAKPILEKIVGPLSFGGFLRSARALNDMSQTDMADFLGISKSTLCDIEKGRQLVSIELAAKIARKCQLSEVVAVKTAIQDHLRRSGLNMEVDIRKTKKSA